MDEGEEKESFVQVFKNSLFNCISNPQSKWITLAGSLRMVVMFAADYFLPLFFLLSFPDFKTQFSLLYGLISIVLGFTSVMSGGILADKLGAKNPAAYAKICQVASILGWPFMMICLLFSSNFYLSIGMIGAKYLLGEFFWSPNITMMQKAIPAKDFGRYISAYQFIITISGCISSFVVGSLINYFNCGTNPVMIGRIVAAVLTFGYLGSAFCWTKAERNFVGHVNN
jgi:hypothetical protein